MSLSGAFSPGVELETALNAVAVADSNFDPPDSDQLQEVETNVTDEAALNASDSQLTEVDDRSNDEGDSTVDRGDECEAPKDVRNKDEDGSTDNGEVIQSAPTNGVANASNIPGESDEKSVVAEPEHAEEVVASEGNEGERAGTPNEDKSSLPSFEQDQAQQPHSDEEQDEAYDGDNFDDYGLPSARATDEQPHVNDKHEVSGYGSEFEEEPAVNPSSVALTPSPEGNQDQGNDEDEEYSNDDFAD
ncbi:hypothetical protein PHYSODRAFT_254985 [Phytophthora sojae]|uniref:Uncharacterized protein n=1 Tax=Phytophthora sojae (strain P6497) TaxID=1094619 RepID=G4YUY8_PHYSP|nr:hypothetical protein PHYSODRAFT_254985 [Phytophthora sojae]EGZ23658.1 hypothetical protein PHYSODRAFT_254985 [Phytophthora sojae]|eukprot:XP_009518946.1 hypothetical protein PHYSODRAFT_254985 [Phytophthora sojae]